MAVTAPVRHSVALNGYSYMCQICKRLVVYLRGIIEVFTQHIGFMVGFEDYLDQICTVGQDLHATLIIFVEGKIVRSDRPLCLCM
jgi:hypothetical protein